MNEFIAGALSGFGQTLLGHPLDTIKVRIQNGVSMNGLKFRNYYRGVSYPLLSSSIINSIIFGVYHSSYPETNNKIISGMLSGLAGAPVVYLFDVYKSKRQMEQTINMNSFLKTKGFIACCLRESIAFSTYFLSYDYLKKEGYSIPISGSIAGLINWTTTYPLDVIRNRQMIDNITMREAYNRGLLWKGYNICAMRALLVNSVGFYLYEVAISFFQK
jgi:solute carrier family 25 carnitine/acylcarnitine transporter 20/29